MEYRKEIYSMFCLSPPLKKEAILTYPSNAKHKRTPKTNIKTKLSIHP